MQRALLLQPALLFRQFCCHAMISLVLCLPEGGNIHLFTTTTLNSGCLGRSLNGSMIFSFLINSDASETMHLLSDCIYSKPCLACYFTGVFWPEAPWGKRGGLTRG